MASVLAIKGRKTACLCGKAHISPAHRSHFLIGALSTSLRGICLNRASLCKRNRSRFLTARLQAANLRFPPYRRRWAISGRRNPDSFRFCPYPSRPLTRCFAARATKKTETSASAHTSRQAIRMRNWRHFCVRNMTQAGLVSTLPRGRSPHGGMKMASA